MRTRRGSDEVRRESSTDDTKSSDVSLRNRALGVCRSERPTFDAISVRYATVNGSCIPPYVGIAMRRSATGVRRRYTSARTGSTAHDVRDFGFARVVIDRGAGVGAEAREGMKGLALAQVVPADPRHRRGAGGRADDRDQCAIRPARTFASSLADCLAGLRATRRSVVAVASASRERARDGGKNECGDELLQIDGSPARPSRAAAPSATD